MKFPQDRRVRKRPEFQAIQRAGKRVSSKNFVWIISRAQKPDAPPRLGITASRKVGNSVRRSRLKRIVRAAFQQLCGMLPPGYDLVVICRQDNQLLNQAEVVAQWQSCAQRVNKLLKELEGKKKPS